MTGGRPVPSDEIPRHDRIIAFLGAVPTQMLSRAVSVAALASARRAVAAYQVRGEPFDGWLASEILARGIRENAATLAVLEIPEYRQRAARACEPEHPDRCEALSHLLAIFT